MNVKEGRLRALSINVVQEARKAHGHGDAPWNDDAARRSEMIYKILHMDDAKTSEQDVGMPTPKHQPETRKELVSVEKLLADMIPDEDRDA